MPLDPITAQQPIVVMAMKDALISLDIATALADIWPDARIIPSSSLAGATKQLSAGTVVDVVFVQCSAERLAVDVAASHPAVKHARVVLVGEEASGISASRRWEVLTFPFTQTSIETLILQPGPNAPGFSPAMR